MVVKKAVMNEAESWTGSDWPHAIQFPFMLQNWQALTFLHWGYPPDVVRPLLPPTLQRFGIELDTYDGKAWVGLVPFLLTRLRTPGLPPFPWVGEFPETNVRTYLRGHDGKPAVWFFTLEADRLAAVLAARVSYGLPYRWAEMTVEQTKVRVEYNSARKSPFGRGDSHVAIEPGSRIELATFDHFLTARYRLYSTFGPKVAYADIDHANWPLQAARLVSLQQNLFEKSGVPQPTGEPVVHYSPSLDVRIGRPRLL